MSIRSDVRLLDGPMQPLQCQMCGACVEVRKSSWDQTSIQWDEESVQTCFELRAMPTSAGPNGHVISGCSALRDSVREAAVLGEIQIQLEE